jgi:hypothetical protein
MPVEKITVAKCAREGMIMELVILPTNPIAQALQDTKTVGNFAIYNPSHGSTQTDFYQMQYLWLSVFKTEVR